MLDALERWWHRSNHYDWLSGYLADRGMRGGARALMAFLAASFVACLLGLLASADGPSGTVPVAMTLFAVGGGVAGSVLFIVHWPSRRESFAFAVITNASIALACLAYPQPLPSVVGCIAFATIGAYIALFHLTGLVLYNFVVAAVVVTVGAARVAVSGHPVLAAVDWWLIIQINIALPLAIQILVRALGVDLLRAERDPLTGLLNRRTFHRDTSGLIGAGRAADVHLVVALIDLDGFKAVNDHYGHAAGDEALVHVAQAIAEAAGDNAVVARSGGEEFLVATTSPTPDCQELAQRLCTAVAESPAGVTASVGTTAVRLADTEGPDKPLVDRLVATADWAMYRAKRSGGNGFRHQDTDPVGRRPPDLDDGVSQSIA
ncbi:GGDEF domain-containing protein [Mycobacterium sp. CVI_P3]|uniref:GGDEF domain-containing protein n=1 Tax=Mycobacterium pinniadriaticum TaxID=2994102 RepID=A0ABT3SP64_9MYCO|nr:GGDEF domain-containing protein [Mycobacterium pinniadriaticum]MCX2934840.1 GGDEF domain-containing protein [Mycobacterium pinniadriaticum]MCX2941243.1 GGDEF domain-containing protein [Mycobacterium pinniadriaticum]